MVKKAAKAEVNNFIKGIITEASPLNFPANASADEENFEVSIKGSRIRRLGMGFELNHTEHNPGMSVPQAIENYPVVFTWNGVGGNDSLNIGVVQANNRLDFFDMSYSSASTNGYLGSLTGISLGSTIQFSFASVDGKLVVVSGDNSVGVVSYESGVFSIEYGSIKTRDIWGVEETTEPNYETDATFRGTTNDQHTYNLQNQSWGIPRKDSGGTLVDPATKYNTDLLKYPSNSEAVWVGLQFQPSATPFERLYTNLYEEVLGADTKAAKGYFIIDAVERGGSRTLAFSDNHGKHTTLTDPTVVLPQDTTTGGATIVAEFAGRVWYGGFSGEVNDGDARSPNLSKFIFFSQLIRSKQDFFKCYQEGDPTSRENSDVVDTDGGFVRISGMNKLVGMVALGASMLVIADNGVWLISGGSDYGFTPTNLKVDKLSSFGGSGRFSIVEQLGRAFYWGEDGIFVVSKNQLGDYEVNSLTETTIQTLYDTIPTESKHRAVGVYDRYNKKIRWLYKFGDLFTGTSTFELIFDVVSSAFTKFRIVNPIANDIEVVSIAEPVIEFQQCRYLALTTDGFSVFYTFSYYRDATWRDWPHTVNNGQDAVAYIVTGEQTGGDSSLPKQIPYVTMHFYRTESGVDASLVPQHQSGCIMRFRWDWSYNTTSNKWSRPEQVYRYRKARFVTDPFDTFDTGFTVVTSKNKIRGRGKAFAMYLSSEEYKDCRIIGWNLSVDANAIT